MMKGKVYVLECYDHFRDMSYILGIYHHPLTPISIKNAIFRDYGSGYVINDEVVNQCY